MTPVQLEPISAIPLAMAPVVVMVLYRYALVGFRFANRVLRVEPDSVLDVSDGGRIELPGLANPLDERRLLRALFISISKTIPLFRVRRETRAQYRWERYQPS